jgi:hypothetical protein
MLKFRQRRIEGPTGLKSSQFRSCVIRDIHAFYHLPFSAGRPLIAYVIAGRRPSFHDQNFERAARGESGETDFTTLNSTRV